MWFLFALVQFARAIWKSLKDPQLRSLIVLTGIILLSGTVFYHRVEGLSWLDAAYFCVVTLTTVGYGDFTPQTALGKVFTIIYLFVGLGILAGFVSIIANQALEDGFPQRFRAGRDQSDPEEDSE